MKLQGLIQKFYNRNNRRYFGNKLPKNTEFFWAHECPWLNKGELKKFNKRYYGQTQYWNTIKDTAYPVKSKRDTNLVTIVLNDGLQKDYTLLQLTLLHEMIHTEGIGGHGKRFRDRMHKLMRDGAYLEVLVKKYA